MQQLPRWTRSLVVVLLAVLVGFSGVGGASGIVDGGTANVDEGSDIATDTGAIVGGEDVLPAQSGPERSDDSDDGARFEVTDVETNAPVRAGETVNVTVEVTNVGETTGEGEVWFRLDSFRKDDATMRLEPGESERVLLQYDSDRHDAALWTLTVATANHVVTDELRIEPRAPTFEVTDASVSEAVSAGDLLTVTVTVANVGDAVGTGPVGVEIDRHRVDEGTVRLAPGENASLSFDYRTTSEFAGERTVTIYTDDGVTELPVLIETPTASPDADTPTESTATPTATAAAATQPTGLGIPGSEAVLTGLALLVTALVAVGWVRRP